MSKSITGVEAEELKFDISRTLDGEGIVCPTELLVDQDKSYVTYVKYDTGETRANGTKIWKNTDEVKEIILTGKDYKLVQILEQNGAATDDLQDFKVIIYPNEKTDALVELTNAKKLDVLKMESFHVKAVGYIYTDWGKQKAGVALEFHAENAVPVIPKSAAPSMKKEG